VPRGPSSSREHAWLFDVLIPDRSVAAWSSAGGLPGGWQPVQRFTVLPGGAGRGFWVSPAPRRAAASALTSYNALRPARRRLARAVMGAGLRTGLAQRAAGPAVELGVAPGVTPGQAADGVLTEHLAQHLGCGPLAFAVGGGSGPYRKPVLQAFRADGTPAGYAKIGWNDWSAAAVRTEAAALRRCAAHQGRLRVPAVLGHFTWHGMEVLITAPLPPGVRRPGPASKLPDEALIREISGLSGPPHRAALAGSEWWATLRARASAVAGGPGGPALQRICGQLEESAGHQVLEFGHWHGDLVPWNLARHGGHVYAWDWETSATAAPAGFDAVHYHFQVAFVARARPLAAAAVAGLRRAGPVLDALDVHPACHHLLRALHLTELFVRHEEARASTGSHDSRFYPAVEQVLGELAAPVGRPALRPAGQAS
jgi:hypothetical protein